MVMSHIANGTLNLDIRKLETLFKTVIFAPKISHKSKEII